jgi:hypothetical protein
MSINSLNTYNNGYILQEDSNRIWVRFQKLGGGEPASTIVGAPSSIIFFTRRAARSPSWDKHVCKGLFFQQKKIELPLLG